MSATKPPNFHSQKKLPPYIIIQHVFSNILFKIKYFKYILSRLFLLAGNMTFCIRSTFSINDAECQVFLMVDIVMPSVVLPNYKTKISFEYVFIVFESIAIS